MPTHKPDSTLASTLPFNRVQHQSVASQQSRGHHRLIQPQTQLPPHKRSTRAATPRPTPIQTMAGTMTPMPSPPSRAFHGQMLTVLITQASLTQRALLRTPAMPARSPPSPSSYKSTKTSTPSPTPTRNTFSLTRKSERRGRSWTTALNPPSKVVTGMSMSTTTRNSTASLESSGSVTTTTRLSSEPHGSMCCGARMATIR